MSISEPKNTPRQVQPCQKSKEPAGPKSSKPKQSALLAKRARALALSDFMLRGPEAARGAACASRKAHAGPRQCRIGPRAPNLGP